MLFAVTCRLIDLYWDDPPQWAIDATLCIAIILFLCFLLSIYLGVKDKQKNDASVESRKNYVVRARELVAPLVTYVPDQILAPNIVDTRNELIDLCPYFDGATKSNKKFRLLANLINSVQRVWQVRYGDLYNSTEQQKQTIYDAMNADAIKFMEATK